MRGRLWRFALDSSYRAPEAALTSQVGPDYGWNLPSLRSAIADSEEESVKARYTRLFTVSDGTARFQDLEVRLEPGFAVPPAEPLHAAQFLPAEGTFWVGAPSTWVGDTRHPAPRRMIFVTVQGEYQIEAGDGATRRFPAGSVLLLEDTTGAGHSTKITSAEHAIVFAVGLRTDAV